MPRTKKDQELIDQLQAEVRVARALRFTDAPGPDVLPQGLEWRQEATGFYAHVINNEPSARVTRALSSKTSHATASHPKDPVPGQTNSQNPIQMFSTRLGALRHARTRVEKICAEALAKIDKQIEDEILNPTPLYPKD